MRDTSAHARQNLFMRLALSAFSKFSAFSALVQPLPFFFSEFGQVQKSLFPSLAHRLLHPYSASRVDWFLKTVTDGRPRVDVFLRF